MSIDELPIVNWPDKSGIYKVVQLEIDDKPHLRFGEREELHAKILMNLLRNNDILYKTIGREYDMGYFEVPALRGERYRVYGASMAEVDFENKKVYFYGRSIGYGISFDRRHLDSIKELQPDWTIELK